MSSSALLLLGDPIPAPPCLGGVFFKFLSEGVLLVLVFFLVCLGDPILENPFLVIVLVKSFLIPYLYFDRILLLP